MLLQPLTWSQQGAIPTENLIKSSKAAEGCGDSTCTGLMAGRSHHTGDVWFISSKVSCLKMANLLSACLLGNQWDRKATCRLTDSLERPWIRKDHKWLNLGHQIQARQAQLIKINPAPNDFGPRGIYKKLQCRPYFRSGSGCPIKFGVIIPASAIPWDFILHKGLVFLGSGKEEMGIKQREF